MPTHRDLRHEPVYAEVRAYAAQVYGEQSNQSIRASSISVAGDASKAALTTWRFDRLEGKGRPVIALVDLRSGEATYPLQDDGEHQMPAWSPDGSRLAWLEKRGRFFELVTAMATGLQQRSRVEGLSGVVEAFVWAQDGRRLLIQTADSDADLAGYQGATAGISDTNALPSWVPTIETPSQENRSRRLWVHEVGSDRSTCVSGQLTVWEAAWAGSDSAIAIVSDNPGETAWYEARLARIDSRTKQTRTLYRPKEQLGRPAASPSGTNIAVIEAVASDRGLIAGDVVVINSNGEIERPALNGIAVTALAWRDERTLAFAGLRDFDMIVGELDLDEGTCRESWSSPDLTSGDPYPEFCLHGDSGFALLVDGYHTPSTVLVVNKGEAREIATFAPPAVASLVERSGRIERLSWRAPDGLDIQGLVVTPEGAGPFPLVTMIHGGPVFCHRGRWLANPYYGDIQFLVRKGYALFLPNPRGSGGRGNAFADRIRGDMGGAECGDLFSGIDLLVSRGIADPKRLAAIGASHGGFMTAWLVTQDQRFAAAVSVAPVSNWLSQHWTSNIPRFDELFIADDPRSAGGNYTRRSPVMHAHKARTPTMVVAGMLDRCTPPSQAVEFYNALGEGEAERALLLYPEEGHRVQSLPARIDYISRVYQWFDRWMPAEAHARAK